MPTKRKTSLEFLWSSNSGKWPSIWVASWTDPSSETSKTWMSPEDVKKVNPLPCFAAGFLVERTKTCVKLCVTVSANGYSGQIVTIPLKGLDYLKKLADVGKAK